MLQVSHFWFTACVTSGSFNSPYKYALRKNQLTGIISGLNKGENRITWEYVSLTCWFPAILKYHVIINCNVTDRIIIEMFRWINRSLFSEDDLLKTKMQTWFVTCIRAQIPSCQHFGSATSLWTEQKQNLKQSVSFRQYVIRARQAVNRKSPQISQARCWAPEWNQKKKKKSRRGWNILSVKSLRPFGQMYLFLHSLCSLYTNITVRACNNTVLCT